MFQLRPYQIDAIELIRKSIRDGYKRIICYSPTGSGKTELGISIIRSAIEKNKHVGFVCNRISLVNQASHRFAKSHIPHGIIQGQNSCYTQSNVVICSIQTLAKRGYPPFDLIVIDEAHGCTADAYVNLLRTYNNVPVIGLSATPFTHGLGRQYEWGKLFDTMVCAITIRELIEQDFLVDCDIYAPSAPDLKDVKIVRGDYDEKQLSVAVDKAPLIGDIVEHWKKLASGLQTVIFATSIAHSKHIVESFLAAGITAEYIDCYTSEQERADILDRYNSGVTMIISNVSVLAEGWDAPATACMILARPTRSLTRWIQMVGRALRPHAGKERAIILDHSGTCHRLGYPTDDLPLELNDGKKSESAKTDQVIQEKLPRKCPHCHFMIPAGTGLCPKCGTKLQKQDKTKHEAGELKKVDRKPVYTKEQKQMLWSESLGLMEQRKKSIGWASHLYKSLTGVWPTGLQDKPAIPSEAVINMATHNAIAYAHSQRRRHS